MIYIFPCADNITHTTPISLTFSKAVDFIGIISEKVTVGTLDQIQYTYRGQTVLSQAKKTSPIQCSWEDLPIAPHTHTS